MTPRALERIIKWYSKCSGTRSQSHLRMPSHSKSSSSISHPQNTHQHNVHHHQQPRIHPSPTTTTRGHHHHRRHYFFKQMLTYLNAVDVPEKKPKQKAVSSRERKASTRPSSTQPISVVLGKVKVTAGKKNHHHHHCYCKKHHHRRHRH